MYGVAFQLAPFLRTIARLVAVAALSCPPAIFSDMTGNEGQVATVTITCT